MDGQGSGDFLAFFYVPLSFLIISLIIIGVIIEYICYKCDLKYVFNFPYKKIPFVFYILFFYGGLICCFFPIMCLLFK